MRKILGYIKGNFHDFLEIMVDVLNEFLSSVTLSAQNAFIPSISSCLFYGFTFDSK